MFEQIKLDPDRTVRTKKEMSGGFKYPKQSLDEVAVYTFPDVIMNNGGPLVFRGSLRAAQEAHSLAVEATRKRVAASEAGKLATAKTTVSAPFLQPKDEVHNFVMEEERHPPKDPYLAPDVDRLSIM